MRKWWMADAEWWEFWQPQSGWFGGVIAGVLILGALKLVGLW